MESEKWKISDFVMIGILSAVYGAVTLGIGMLTATVNPFLHLFSPAIIAIILGTVVLFVVKKINKFGALTLFITVSIVLFSGFSGMFYEGHQAVEDPGELGQVAQVAHGGLEGVAHLGGDLAHSHDRQLGEDLR